MEKEEILKKLQTIFIDVLDNDKITLNENTSADDIEEWDSLSNVQLMVAIEKEFNIKLASKEIMECENVGDIMTIIERKIV